MSKTYKTRPLSVRMHDRKDHGVGIEEYHNHVNRECDLPTRDYQANLVHIEENEKNDGWLHEICHWSFTYTGKGLCGCKMCTEQIFRKAENRKERHRVKQELQKARGLVSDVEESVV